MNKPLQQSLVLLMLAPLVAASYSSGIALFLGVSSAAILLVASLMTYTLQRYVVPDSNTSLSARLPLVMLVLAVTTTLWMLFTQQQFYQASLLAGIWLPLISANLFIVSQLLLINTERSVTALIISSLKTATSIIVVLLLLAMAREFLGNGRLFTQMNILVEGMPPSGIQVIASWPRLKLFEMASGALLILSLALAASRAWQSRDSARRVKSDSNPQSHHRVRVTGKIS